MSVRTRLCWLVACLGLAACVTTSPALDRSTEPLADQAPAEDPEDGTLSIRKGGEQDANTAQPTAGTPECLDAAFLGSPDARPEPRQVPLPCWRALLQAAPRVTEDVDKARSVAEAQRQALGAPLRQAETDACAGLTETEVALSPFYFREDIVRIEALPDGHGARVRFGAVPYLTEARMKQVIDCHLARAHVICDPSTSDYCPLALGNVTTHIHLDQSVLIVDIEGTSPESTDAILERLETLRPR